MPSLFDKPSPGDKFKPNASFQSLLVDMVNWWMTRQVQPGIETIHGPDLTIRNMEEDGLDQFSVIRLGDIVLDPDVSETAFRNDLVFDAAAPAEDEIFLITQEPIAPDGGVGEARISGFSRVRVNFSNADHAFAAPEDDNYDYLVSQASDGPAAVIWKESGTGTKWAVVSLNVSSTPGLGATTTLCINDCRGSEYCLELPRAWLKPNEGECGDAEDPPGGTGEVCLGCEEPLNQICVALPGVQGGCSGCEIFTLPLTLTMAAPCQWELIEEIIDCGNELFGSSVRTRLVGAASNDWTLVMEVPFGSQGFGNTVVLAYYESSDTWDCESPLTLTLVNVPSEVCINWPATVVVQPCSAGTPPTINFDSQDLCDDAATLTIIGTGFSTTPANNILDFSSGTATCTSVTGTTSLVATFSSPPSVGALMCIVINENGTSILPMQVALVVACGGTGHQDSFTEGSPPVLLTAHTPETGGSYTNLDGQMACNSAGRAVNSSADDDFGFIFDPGIASGTFSFKFLLPPASQDAGVRSMFAYFRYLDANNYFRLNVTIPPTADSTSQFVIQKTIFGTTTTVTSASVTLNSNTQYTCEIVTTSSTVEATINGVTAGPASDTALGLYTKRGVAFHSQFSDSNKPYCDDLLMEN